MANNITNKMQKAITGTEKAIDSDAVGVSQAIVNAVKEEVADYKLTREMRTQAMQEFGVDEATVNGWQTVSDLMDHLDLVELAKRHPEEINRTIASVLSFLSFIPVVGALHRVIEKLPDSVLPKLVQTVGLLSPEHILNVISKKRLEKKERVGEKKTPKYLTIMQEKVNKVKESGTKLLSRKACEDASVEKYVYPAVFTSEAEGYSIVFPDLEGCYTCGDSLEDGLKMASEVLALVLSGYKKEKREFPIPTDQTQITLKEGEFVNYVVCDARSIEGK